MKKLIIAAAVVAGMSSTAFAADLDTDVVDPVFGWGGFYAGAHIGIGRADATTTGTSGTPFDDGNGVGYSTDLDSSGVLLGLQVGYNIELQNNIVVGIEFDAGYFGADDDQFGYPGADVSLNDTGMVADYGAYGVIAARLGLAHDRSLFYLKGGLAIADIDITAGDLDGALASAADFDPGDTTNVDGTETGYAIGGGIEYAFRENWSVKAEYLYMDFGSVRSRDTGGDGYSTDLDIHTFKIGVNYRF